MLDSKTYAEGNWKLPTWEDLSPLERKIKEEERMLIELKKIFNRSNTDYSNLLVRLIDNELSSPRL